VVHTRKEVDKLILRALRTNYTVDIEIGEIYSKRTGRPLYRFYCGRDSTKYAFVRICFDGKKYGRSLSKLLWMFTRNRTVPYGFKVHHDDHNHQNNNWRNLICIYDLDHQHHHARYNGSSKPYPIEEVPF
jgi:hypothetical protein